MTELCGKLRAQLLRRARVLQNQRALDVAVTVQAGRENKVAFQQCGILSENFENVFFSHGLSYSAYGINQEVCCISSNTAAAAAAGSGAAVMGRPITR